VNLILTVVPSWCFLLGWLVVPDGVTISLSSVDRRQKWWCDHDSTSFPNIAAAALRLLVMSVTIGAAERNWSIWGQVYTKLRNRLGIQRGEMNVFIRQNLKLQDNCLPDDEDVAV
jgi:hypothetical protein